jgi:Zn-dependent protease with chaperone function
MDSLKRAFVKLWLLAMLGLFLLPGITIWFVGHAESNYTDDLRAALQRSLTTDADLSATEKAGYSALVDSMTVGGLCEGAYPAFNSLREEACAPTEDLGQFHIAHQTARYTLLLGGFTLLLIVALALLAYQVPRLQVSAFTFGWWSLRGIAALEVLIQAAMLVWLSYWLTAVFFNIYIVKLILIAAALAAMGVWVAISAIFRRLPADNAISGELIGVAQAPDLWARIQQFSRTLSTAPPDQLIAGIDANFFVTQTPILLPNQRVNGRSLFVSLPLLRILARDEADAVLAHEMAHFSGGDTATSAALGPKLHAYGQYMAALGQSGLTVLAFFVLNLFRAAFELALSRASREREFAADKQAAQLTSAAAMSRALIKVAAYASYRNTVEQQLFNQNQQHQGPLGLAGRVAAGLSTFAQSDDFHSTIAAAAIPHPFDSHPPLQQRMEHVGAVIPAAEFAAIVAAPPAQTWVDLIPDADALEAPQWQQYETAFADEHEQNLAFRYEPASEEERQIVLKYFPGASFTLKKDGLLQVNYQGIQAPDATLSWDDVSAIQYDDGSFGTRDTVTITHPDKGALGLAKSTKLKLALAAGDRDRFKEALGRYWQRHQIMRKLQAAG